jgi:hypothetical protein
VRETRGKGEGRKAERERDLRREKKHHCGLKEEGEVRRQTPDHTPRKGKRAAV